MKVIITSTNRYHNINIFPFLVLIFSILFIIEPTNLKNALLEFPKKHDQTSINLTNIFDFNCEFSYYVGFDEIKWLCDFT